MATCQDQVNGNAICTCSLPNFITTSIGKYQSLYYIFYKKNSNNLNLGFQPSDPFTNPFCLQSGFDYCTDTIQKYIYSNQCQSLITSAPTVPTTSSSMFNTCGNLFNPPWPGCNTVDKSQQNSFSSHFFKIKY